MIDPVLDDEAIHRWLDDPEASGVKAEPLAPAAGYRVFERAIETASHHAGCPKDDREFGLIVEVIGSDGVSTLQTIPPGINPSCVVGALRTDPEARALRYKGFEPIDPPIAAPEEPGEAA